MLSGFEKEASADWPCFEPVCFWDRNITVKQDDVMSADALATQRASPATVLDM